MKQNLRFGNIDFGYPCWTRKRRYYTGDKPITKTFYVLKSTEKSDRYAIVKVACDGVKGRGLWYVEFPRLDILNKLQNPNGKTYYKTSTQARRAAEKLISKAEVLKAFI